MRINARIRIGLALLGVLILSASAGPLVVGDPFVFKTIARLKPPSSQNWFGTDNFGRDVLARVVLGGRTSLWVGFCVAMTSGILGLSIGVVAGYYRRVDAIVMRFMDGLMAIPSILLAIALVSLTGASMLTVILAITIPEVPRVVRLVRSVVLTTRDLAYVDAAVTSGTRGFTLLWRHILPSALPPLIVQATYVAGAAILIEAALGFLGIGTPPSIPTWGNMIGTSQRYFTVAPWIIMFPGIALAVAVLAVNVLGDGLRDGLDPRLSRHV